MTIEIITGLKNSLNLQNCLQQSNVSRLVLVYERAQSTDSLPSNGRDFGLVKEMNYNK